MKNLKLYELESAYLAEKDTHEYPTVSYSRDTNKVWYKMKKKPNKFTCYYDIAEGEVGTEVTLASGLSSFYDAILNGVSLRTPVSSTTHVVTPTSYGVGATAMTFTEDSWIKSPTNPWDITFDKPLTENDYFLVSLVIGGETQTMPMSISDAVESGIIGPTSEDLTKFQCFYTIGLTDSVDFDMLLCAFTPQDDNLTVTEDNFIGTTLEAKSGGAPSDIVVTPTEATTYVVEYVASEGIVGPNINAAVKQAHRVDFSTFDTSKMTNMSNMFLFCKRLTSLDISNFDTSNVTNMSAMFRELEGPTTLDLSSFDTSKVTNMREMFSQCRCRISSLDLSNFDTSNVTNMSYMFSSWNSITSLDLSNFNTSNVTNMGGMFSNCRSLISITFGDNFNTSNVTNMGGMFDCCSGLTSLDVSNFDTSNVTEMCSMFNACMRLTSLDVSNFNTSKVTSMGFMFDCCSGLTSLDVSNFDTSNVTSMGGMFSHCSSLTSLDLSNFNTSNVTSMGIMFQSCARLTSVTFGSQADVSKVTVYNNMFDSIHATGTLYYPSAYADPWNKLLVTQQSSTKFPSTWTAIAVDYENQ